MKRGQVLYDAAVWSLHEEFTDCVCVQSGTYVTFVDDKHVPRRGYSLVATDDGLIGFIWAEYVR